MRHEGKKSFVRLIFFFSYFFRNTGSCLLVNLDLVHLHNYRWKVLHFVRKGWGKSSFKT